MFEDYAAPIRDVIEKFHLEHSSDGDFISCFSCVVAGLNAAERDYVERVRGRNR